MMEMHIACGLLLVATAALAASFDDRHRAESAANPPGLTCVLRTTTGQTTFHPGERIPITLQFSSTAAGKYSLDAAEYDRGGRMYCDRFFADRDDAVDPLVDYFGSGVLGGIAGGLRAIPVLQPEPTDVHLTLNDWYRFDKPGTYRVFVKSNRLTRERLPGEPGEPGEPGNRPTVGVAAVSNILRIEITAPDPAWDTAKLAELRSILDTPANSVNRPRQAAREDLGYLGTPGAVRLLMELLREGPDLTDSFGLIRSPYRPLVIDALDRYIEDPSTPITQWTVSLRTLFDFVKLTLCVDDQCREMWSTAPPQVVEITAADGSPIYGRVFTVGAYRQETFAALQAKVAQYPARTRFRWCPALDHDAFLPDERRDMFDTLAGFTAAHGMRMEPYGEAPCSGR